MLSRRRTLVSILIGIVLLTVPCYILGLSLLWIRGELPGVGGLTPERTPTRPPVATQATPQVTLVVATPTLGAVLPTQNSPATAEPVATRTRRPTATRTEPTSTLPPSPTSTQTAVPSITPLPLITETSTPSATLTLPATPTNTPSPITDTPLPPTETPTSTPVP